MSLFLYDRNIKNWIFIEKMNNKLNAIGRWGIEWLFNLINSPFQDM